MQYLTLDTADALTLDKAFQSLAQPNQSVETTRHLGHVEHPEKDQQALKLPSGVSLYVQPDADVQGFKGLVADWLNADAAQDADGPHGQDPGDSDRGDGG